MKVTHCKVKFLDDNFIDVVSVDQIVQFKKKPPKHVNDFQKTKIYECYYNDKKNKDRILAVQICQLAEIKNDEDIEELLQKRGQFALLNRTTVDDYYNKSDSDSTNSEKEEEDKIDEELGDEEDLHTNSNDEVENKIKDGKTKSKAKKKKVCEADKKMQQQILEEKMTKLTQGKTLNLKNKQFDQSSETLDHPENHPFRPEELIEHLKEEMRVWKNKYDDAITEVEKLKQKYKAVETKLTLYQNINEQLQIKLYLIENEKGISATGDSEDPAKDSKIRLSPQGLHTSSPKTVVTVDNGAISQESPILFSEKVANKPLKNVSKEINNSSENDKILKVGEECTKPKNGTLSPQGLHTSSPKTVVDVDNGAMFSQENISPILFSEQVPHRPLKNVSNKMNDSSENDKKLKVGEASTKPKNVTENDELPPFEQVSFNKSDNGDNFDNGNESIIDESPSLISANKSKGHKKEDKNYKKIKPLQSSDDGSPTTPKLKKKNVQPIKRKLLQSFTEESPSLLTAKKIIKTSKVRQLQCSDDESPKKSQSNEESMRKIKQNLFTHSNKEKRPASDKSPNQEENSIHNNEEDDGSNNQNINMDTDNLSVKNVEAENKNNTAKEAKVCKNMFSKFGEVWEKNTKHGVINMIHLNNNFSIPYENWRQYIKLSDKLYTKKLLREMYTYPEEISRRSVIDSDKLTTPKGKHKRKPISPLKMKTLEKCLKHYYRSKGVPEGKKLEKKLAEKNKFITEDINTAIKAMRSL